MFSSMKRELQSLPFVVRNTFLDLAPWKMILFHYKLYFDLSHLLQNAMAIYTILNKSWLFLKQIKPCNSYPISGSIICTIYTQRLQDDCIVVPIKSISKFPDPAMKFYSVYSRVTVETAAVLVVRFTNSRPGTDRIGDFDTGPDQAGSGSPIRLAGSNRIGYRISIA